MLAFKRFCAYLSTSAASPICFVCTTGSRGFAHRCFLFGSIALFNRLSDSLGTIFDRLKKRGALSPADVDAAMREMRVALLEADVALPVVKDFISKVRERAVGHEVVKSITPGQMVVKIVHDHLVELLGEENAPLLLNTTPPAVILMTGLQGSGKTTTAGKLALKLHRQGKKVMLASLDIYRPAAQQQLELLAGQVGVLSLPIIAGQQPLAIVERAKTAASLQACDVLILDTAGRLHIDETLMAELVAVKQAANPSELLFVADAMTGQDAVTVAKSFHDAVGITGIVLTRIDSDARGGAALSIRHVAGAPIKFLGVGEKLEALEDFYPKRLADRILGMGDIVSLVEKAADAFEQETAEKMAAKMQKGQFDLDDLAMQFKQMRKMGGLGSIMGMIPGIGKMAAQVNQPEAEKKMKQSEAIISSMTPRERRNPKILGASRKRRIANGSGVQVQDVNRLLKQYEQMAGMMKKVSRMDKKQLMRSGIGNLFH